MKKLFIASCILGIILVVLFLTGSIDFNSTVKRALTEGNRFYAANQFNEALEAYNIGLLKDADNTMLNYNAGQASYRLEAYEQAIEYYGKTPGTLNAYLRTGNSNLKLGDGAEDTGQKLQYYTKATETYKQGILTFPENIPLKYNYELVQEKIKTLAENSENQQQNKKQENQEEDQQNQDSGKQEDQENNQQGSPQNEENSLENQGNGENSEENQNPQGSQGNDEQQESSQNEQSASSGEDENEQQSEPEQNEEINDSQSAASGDDDNNEQANAATNETEQIDSEIERVLEMLEKQEEESLKNNQEVKNRGEEDEYDW